MAGPTPTKKQQLEALKIESFTASTAEPGKVQLCQGGASAKGKLRNRKHFITNKLDVHSETQSESQQLQRQRWKETSAKRLKIPKIRMSLLLQGIAAPHLKWNKA